ncbi:MAG TPA: DUF2721 domain-containing protein [Burkholderiales bacterium]|nr:DUF2721 domain-containing protein [Burkholderiales bacterium]
MPAPITDISHVIQLAIAPVFLLTGIGTILNVLTGRLARAVDRRRVLMSEMPNLDAPVAALAQQELAFEHRRIRLVYVAIGLSVLSALLVCLLISIAFIDAFIAMNLSKLVATLFVLALVALTGSIAIFMREIFLAVDSVRAPIR